VLKRFAACFSRDEIKHYNLHPRKREVIAKNWLPRGPIVVGITAGASCPIIVIEEKTLIRLFRAAPNPAPGTRS